jgi:GntR family transcriptional regulator/MocR family aminotransferase
VAKWSWGVVLDVDGDVPLYQQVERELQRAITDGRLAPGDPLPSTRELAATAGVTRNTVVAAYRELAAQGWLSTRPGAVTRVAGALPPAAPRPRKAPAACGFAVTPLPPLRPELPPPRQALRLGAGEPDLRLVPSALVSRALGRALRRRRGALLGYGDPRGVPEYLRAVRGWLGAARGLATDDGRLLSTRGAQHALDLVSRALLRPGDRVLVEALGYAPAWRAFTLAGATLVVAPVDAGGLRVDAVERALCEGPLRAIYVTSHHQYPTTVPLAPDRRRALLELAARHGTAVLEDDYDHEFHYEGRPRLPLAATDPHGVVVYLGTFSKVLAPGLRLGFVHGPPALIDALTELRRASDRQGDAVTESAVAELVEDGALPRHVRRMRAVYQGRRDALAEALRRELGGALTFEVPTGGIGLWAHVDPAIDDERWVERALARGVALRPGRAFSATDERVPGLRLVFSGLDAAELGEAVRRLAAARPGAR